MKLISSIAKDSSSIAEPSIPIDLRVTERDWLALREHLDHSFRGPGCEVGAIGLLGECHAADRHEFLLAQVVWPLPGDITATRGSLVFRASYIRRAHLMMRGGHLAGLATFHTHPFSDENVMFSSFDDDQDPQLADNLLELDPTTRLLSIVLGKRSQRGRLWITPRCARPMRELIVVGTRLRHISLSGSPEPPTASPATIFDRGLALTPEGALSRLSRMVIGIVGVSGTGSLVCELLARAGAQHLVAIDDDVVEDINLNRILYATSEDARHRTPKVQVLRRGIEGLQLGCRVDAVEGNILANDMLKHLKSVDMIFGCLDKAYPRKLLCEFSYRYLKPYIDLGTEIGGDDQGIVSLDARVTYVGPGRDCLLCTGLVTPRELSLESMAYAERERIAQLGYSQDLLLKQPAVMDLNMRAASFGTILLRHLLQPFLLAPIPVSVLENMVTYSVRAQSRARAAYGGCPICRQNTTAGYGDCAAPIGLSGESLAALLGKALGV